MISTFWAKSLPNPKKMAIRRAGILKMETWGDPRRAPRHQNDFRELHDEAQECQDEPSECPDGCPDGPGQPNLLLKVLPKANLRAPGNLRGCFWRHRSPYLGVLLSKRFQSIPFHEYHPVPFHSIHSVPFHSIPFLFHTIPFNSVAPFHPFHSLPFHCHALHAIPGFPASGIPESHASEIRTCRFLDLEPLVGPLSPQKKWSWSFIPENQ